MEPRKLKSALKVRKETSKPVTNARERMIAIQDDIKRRSNTEMFDKIERRQQKQPGMQKTVSITCPQPGSQKPIIPRKLTHLGSGLVLPSNYVTMHGSTIDASNCSIGECTTEYQEGPEWATQNNTLSMYYLTNIFQIR